MDCQIGSLSRPVGSMPPRREGSVVRFDIPKASRQSVARAIFEGLENGEDEIFPDPMAASMAESWCGGAAKTLERQNAALLEGLPVAR